MRLDLLITIVDVFHAFAAVPFLNLSSGFRRFAGFLWAPLWAFGFPAVFVVVLGLSRSPPLLRPLRLREMYCYTENGRTRKVYRKLFYKLLR